MAEPTLGDMPTSRNEGAGLKACLRVGTAPGWRLSALACDYI